MNMRRLRPSPAIVSATLAFFVAVGGAAYAGSKIATSDIENGAVTTKKLANGAATTGKLKNDAATGAKVKESSLGVVPKASNSTTTGGLRIQDFSKKLAPGTALQSVATVGTLTLRFGCEGDGSPLLTVAPAAGAPDQTVRTSAILNGSPTLVSSSGQGTIPGSGISVLSGTETGASFNGTAEALTPGGGVTTVQWAARSPSNIPSANPDGNVCLFWGTAISG